MNRDGKILNPPQNPAYLNFKAKNGVVNPALLGAMVFFNPSTISAEANLYVVPVQPNGDFKKKSSIFLHVNG